MNNGFFRDEIKFGYIFFARQGLLYYSIAMIF